MFLGDPRLSFDVVNFDEPLIWTVGLTFGSIALVVMVTYVGLFWQWWKERRSRPGGFEVKLITGDPPEPQEKKECD